MLTSRSRLLTTTLLVGAALTSFPALSHAQAQVLDRPPEAGIQSTPSPDAGEEGETIVVTGSRIQRRDLTSSSPLAVVQREEFQLTGAVNVDSVINTLPQVVPGTTAFSNNPGGGVSTLNLRGLGDARTLVLVNGRRYVSFDTSQVVDLNTIPAFLLEGVDTITGAGSAVYGSDALAGVVNFRLRNNLNGLEANAIYNITERGDGARYGANIALGSDLADGRGNVTVFGEYFNRKPIFQSARPFSQVALGDGADGLVPLGSSITNRGRFAIAGQQAIAAGNGLGAVTLPRGAGNFGTPFGANFGTLGSPSTAYRNPQDSYNYAPENFLMVPQERYLLGGYGHYEVNDSVTAYAEVTYVNNRVQNELAPTPVNGNFFVNVAQQQQFLSATDYAALQQIDANEAAIAAALTARGGSPTAVLGRAAQPGIVQLGVFRRANETGSRNSLDERNAFRLLAGVRGPLSETFNYDAYYSYARTRNANVQAGNISRSAFQAGLDGTATPINVFGPGALTPAMIDQVSILAQNGDTSTLQVASASISGELGALGLGGNAVGIAFGGEYRKVSSEFIPDTALSSGDVIGFNAGQATAGSYDVKELFGELQVPIIENRPGFQRLQLNGAARYSDYSLSAVGGVFAWSAGAEYAPIRDITFRGNYQRAIRAPNVGELFGGLAIGFPAATDPCSSRNTTNRTDTVRQLCEQTGVPAALVFTPGIQPNNQIQGQFGGNPNLREETSDSWTAGAVVRPSFIPGLNITADYFSIKVDNYISTFGGGLNNTLNLCYNQIQNINSPYCQAVVRDPVNGQIGDQFLPLIANANVASYDTSGVDLQLDYTQPLGFGLLGESSRVNMFFLGTWTEKADFTPVIDQPDIVNRCAGRYGNICGQPQPKFKWTSRLSWIDGPVTTSVRWRHLGPVTDDDPDNDYIVERLKAKDYIDLAFAFNLTEKFTLTAGVNNLFDIQPTQIGDNQQQANTYPGVYDPLGRDFFVSAGFRF